MRHGPSLIEISHSHSSGDISLVWNFEELCIPGQGNNTQDEDV
jgi:hypothetical protein